MMKKYLTEKDVDLAARKGRKSAIEASVRHWQELHRLKPAELLKAEVAPYTEQCALCVRYANGQEGYGRRSETNRSDCGNCPLSKRDNCHNINSAYRNALRAWLKARNLWVSTEESGIAIKWFRHQAKKMIAILKTLH